MELPNRPDNTDDQSSENPRTVMKNDRKKRVAANIGRQRRNTGEEVPKKAATGVKDVMTKRLAQRLQKSKVGKTLGGRTGRRK